MEVDIESGLHCLFGRAYNIRDISVSGAFVMRLMMMEVGKVEILE